MAQGKVNRLQLFNPLDYKAKSRDPHTDVIMGVEMLRIKWKSIYRLENEIVIIRRWELRRCQSPRKIEQMKSIKEIGICDKRKSWSRHDQIDFYGQAQEDLSLHDVSAINCIEKSNISVIIYLYFLNFALNLFSLHFECDIQNNLRRH